MPALSKAQQAVEHPLPVEVDYILNTAMKQRLWWHVSESEDGSFRAFVITELFADNLGKLGIGLASHPYRDEDGELAHDVIGWGWWTHQKKAENIKLTVEAVMDLVYVSPRGTN